MTDELTELVQQYRALRYARYKLIIIIIIIIVIQEPESASFGLINFFLLSSNVPGCCFNIECLANRRTHQHADNCATYIIKEYALFDEKNAKTSNIQHCVLANRV